MNKLFFPYLFLLITLAIASCSKKEESDSENQNYPETTAALTKHTWVYYEYFYDFNTPDAILVWKIDRSTSTYDLGSNQVTFKDNFTYSEVDEKGSTYFGTWSYMNNGTQIKVENSAGTFPSTIEVLNENRYEWLDGNRHYGVMIPVHQQPAVTGTTSQMLSAGTWVYDEYFDGYDQPDPWLSWKPNQQNNYRNLSQNVVQFNADQTYREVDENGVTITGTWSLQANDMQLKVVNNRGTFISTIRHLSNDRFEWVSADGAIYGEMVHIN